MSENILIKLNFILPLCAHRLCIALTICFLFILPKISMFYVNYSILSIEMGDLNFVIFMLEITQIIGQILTLVLSSGISPICVL